MANRHLARSTVLQSLFEWDFGKKNQNEAYEIFERNSKEFADGINEGDKKFMVSLMESILEKQKDLDFVIEKAAPDWPIDKISIIDLNILRIGLYELLFEDKTQVPPKVAINEAIELAKAFGSESSSRFVNGVLGAVYKEMGEPGKSDKGNFDNENIPIENLLGSIIYAKHDGDIYLALVHDVFGHWTLSKGHLQEGEGIQDGLQRIAKEELGLNVTLKNELGKNEYTAFNPEKGKLRKKVSYFLAESDFDDLKLKESGGLDDAKWFKLKDIIDLNFYDDILPIVTKAVNILLGKK